MIDFIHPVLNDFSGRVNAKSMREYKDFMQNVEIQSFLQRYMKKNALESFIRNFKSFEDQSEKQLARIETTRYNLHQWALHLDLSVISSARTRCLMLNTIAANCVFVEYPCSEKVFNSDNFHRTYRDVKMWDEVLGYAYLHQQENYTVFLELLALHLLGPEDFFALFQDKKDSEQSPFELLRYTVQDKKELEVFERYLTYLNVRGDLGYPNTLTLLESCMHWEKYQFAGICVHVGEGKHLRYDSLTKYLMREDVDALITVLRTHHQQKMNEYEWQRVWKISFLQSKDQIQQSDRSLLSVQTLEFGERLIPERFWMQVFRCLRESVSYSEQGQRYELIDKSELIHQGENFISSVFASGEPFVSAAQCATKVGLMRLEPSQCLRWEQETHPGTSQLGETFYQLFNTWRRRQSVLCNVQGGGLYRVSRDVESMEGALTLSEALERFGENVTQHMNLDCLSESILISMLLYTEFNGPEDELLIPESIGKKQQYILTNTAKLGWPYGTRCFAPPFIKRDQNVELNVKNILFCLSVMHQHIPVNVVRRFRSLQVYDVLRVWLYQLQDWFSESQKYKGQQTTEVFYGVPIFKKQLQQLYQRFQRMVNFLDKLVDRNEAKQHIFSYARFKHHQKIQENKLSFQDDINQLNQQDFSLLRQVTHQELFEAIDPELAQLYEKFSRLSQVPLLQRFEGVCRSVPGNGSFIQNTLPTFEARFRIEKTEDWKDMGAVISNLQWIGPGQALVKLKSYDQVYANLQHQSFLQATRLELSHQLQSTPQHNLAQGLYKRQASEGRLESIEHHLPLQRYHQCLSHIKNTKQMTFFLQNVDFKSLDDKQIQQFFELLQKAMNRILKEYTRPIHHLIFQKVTAKNVIQSLEQSLDRITLLSLGSSQKVKESDIKTISEACTCLQYLNLTDAEGLTQISGNAASSHLSSQPLRFPSLKTLIIKNSNQLKHLDIEGQHIINIRLDGCTNLHYFSAICRQIQALGLAGCRSLTPEAVALFIISGVETVVDADTCKDFFKMQVLSQDRETSYEVLVQQCFSEVYFKRFDLFTSSQHVDFCQLLNKRGLGLFNTQSFFQDITNYFSKGSTSQQKNSKIKNECLKELWKLLLSQNLKVKNIILGGNKDSLGEQAVVRDALASLRDALIDLKAGKNVPNSLSTYPTHITSLDLRNILGTVEIDFECLGQILKHLTSQKNDSVPVLNNQSSQGKVFEQNLSLKSQKTQIQKNDRTNISIYLPPRKGMQFFPPGTLQILLPQIDDVPINILSLSEISTLFSVSTQLTCDALQQFFLSGKRISALQLNGCKLDDTSLSLLENMLINARYLYTLDLSNNLLQGQSLHILARMSQLQHLYLDGNTKLQLKIQQQQNEIVIQTPWKSLRSLSLKNMGAFDKNDWQIFFKFWLPQCRCLNFLDLSDNENLLSIDQNKDDLARDFQFQGCPALRELRLCGSLQQLTRFKSEKQKYECGLDLFVYLQDPIRRIQSLDLSRNSLGDDLLGYFQPSDYLRILKIGEDHSFSDAAITKFLLRLLNQSNCLVEVHIECVQSRLGKDRNLKDIYLKLLNRLEQNKIVGRQRSNQSLVGGIEFSQIGNSMHQSSFFNGEAMFNSMLYNENRSIIELQSRKSIVVDADDRFRIGLSIDGGGMRGLIPATMLQYLCEQTKLQIYEMFDVVAGTSIGGIIALGATGTLNGGISPIADHNELVNIFEKNGQRIFQSSRIRGFFHNLMDRARFEKDGIETVLSEYFQNARLSDVMRGTNVIVTAVKRCSSAKNMAKIFSSQTALFNENKNFYMRDVARATSAAPTYFPSAEIKNINNTKNYSLIDGGVGQNNPAKIAIDDLRKQAQNNGNGKNFFLLSLGTGQAQGKDIETTAGYQHVAAIIDIFGDSSTDFITKELLTNYADQFLRVQPRLRIKKADADLASTKKELLQYYKQVSIEEAELMFNKEVKYGPYNDRTLIEWLKENTDRKKEII